MITFTRQFIAASALFTWATAVFSHDGHGLSGTHWHATDALGFVVISGLIAVAIWLSKK